MADKKFISTEDKVLERVNKFYIKHIEDLPQSDLIKKEFEYLLKSYKKLNTRYSKVVKQSDVEQHRINQENELTKDNMSKLKSHMISKVGDTVTKNLQEKKELAKGLEDSQKLINNQKLKINSLTQKINSLSNAIERILTNEEKNSKELLSIKKDVIKIEDILKKEIAQSNTYNYHFTLVKVQIKDIKDIKEKLEITDNYGVLIENTKKSITQSCKQYDFVTYDGEGKFYIIYHHIENTNTSSLITSITQKKRIDNIDIYFETKTALHKANDHALVKELLAQVN